MQTRHPPDAGAADGANRGPWAPPAPLGPILLLSFFNSLGTGVVTNGVFFIAEQGYRSGRTLNYGLGTLLGATYIGGAMLAQPALRRLRGRFSGLTDRAVLAWLMVALGALCVIPACVTGLGAAREGPGRAWGLASLWVMVAAYSPLTGVLWPMIESYVSGGRSGQPLRRAIGRWNVTWSSALILGYWGIAPLIRTHPGLVILGLGAIHLACVAAVSLLPSRPGPHVDADHEPHPPVYHGLLYACRLLLPMSYLVHSTLGPYLAGAMRRVVGDATLQTALVSAGVIPRTIGFLVMSRLRSWHGRWSTLVVGGALVLAGFAAAVIGPELSPGPIPGGGGVRPIALAVTLAGLAAYGIGMSVVYSAAIYYALAVGKSEVGAGGTHEALIGLGYTVGPTVGLAASASVSVAWIPEGAFSPVVLGVTALAGGSVAIAVWKHVRRHSGTGRPGGASKG